MLKNSTYIVLAYDQDRSKVVGFINAISDKVLSAYIPLLEVIPDYKNQRIGTQLVEKMLEQLNEYYMIDLLCDIKLQDYYMNKGMIKATGMMKRNYRNQYLVVFNSFSVIYAKRITKK
ncbi:GNAT family N-acetyltransferase [Paenibacillus sp. N1-5-1-14]|uniref:GNAT family N-acetyltransferase n=1 Tax=Paenibacillus radicibacter TaxID=2972488 RepID=UPI0021596FFD|nr:GNAT family N-acetyltransferase [Paenibacillus radicibacter]MCR8641999.1 GNAT family N-acetyltransferase [Paenibacillus radicibacter]